MPDSRNILVFRKRLLAYSETFIADQGQRLPTMSAVFSGYEWDASGRSLLDGSNCIVLDDYTPSLALAKTRIRSGLGYNSRWLAAIRQYHPSLVHAHFFNDGTEAVKLASALSVPLITTLHGHDITKARLSGKELACFFDRVDRVIAVSDFIAEQALRRGCPSSKLIQHYIGIDIERFRQTKQESSHPSLLFVGRLVAKKGCEYLLQAMSALMPRYPELTLTLVGDGPLKASLMNQADELNLPVTFTGSQPASQIRQMLATHWLFVAPSITADNGDAEGLGMVFLEAQAMATPVVSFASGGVVEAVQQGETGLLGKEKDVAALTDHIDQLLSDSPLRLKMGQSGVKRVLKKFNINQQCEILEGHYQSLISS